MKTFARLLQSQLSLCFDKRSCSVPSWPPKKRFVVSSHSCLFGSQSVCQDRRVDEKFFGGWPV